MREKLTWWMLAVSIVLLDVGAWLAVLALLGVL